MARRGRGQFQFTVAELSVLAASFAVTALIVFLLGFYVGRENAAQHGPLDERVARIPVSGAPERAPAAQDDVPTATAPERVPAPGPETQPRGERPEEESAAAVPSVPYTVQVLATRNRREAETLREDLARRRIGAFVTEVEESGARWYRVRIGRYEDFESARAMQERVRRDYGLGQAYVVPYRVDAR